MEFPSAGHVRSADERYYTSVVTLLLAAAAVVRLCGGRLGRLGVRVAELERLRLRELAEGRGVALRDGRAGQLVPRRRGGRALGRRVRRAGVDLARRFGRVVSSGLGVRSLTKTGKQAPGIWEFLAGSTNVHYYVPGEA